MLDCTLRNYFLNKDSKFKINFKRINKVRNLEKKAKLSNVITFKKFYKKIDNIKMKLNFEIQN